MTHTTCDSCNNKGKVLGLTQETYCDHCVWQGRSWRKDYFTNGREDTIQMDDLKFPPINLPIIGKAIDEFLKGEK